MASSPQERLSILRDKLEQQCTTVDALKRDGHVHADAERQLKQMQADLQENENTARPT